MNLPEFYLNPPKDMKDLLPTAWNTDNKEIDSGLKRPLKIIGKNKKIISVKYRNYFWGNPTKWNGKGYKRYFPSIKDDTDIPRHMRILRQSLGSSTVGDAITQFSE